MYLYLMIYLIYNWNWTRKDLTYFYHNKGGSLYFSIKLTKFFWKICNENSIASKLNFQHVGKVNFKHLVSPLT